MKYCFDDVLIAPQFSNIASRKDVGHWTNIANKLLELPIISANMDTVTEVAMAQAMVDAGGVGALHRFMPIEDNIKMLMAIKGPVIASIGLGKAELERAEALAYAGADWFCLDVAHGAQMAVVEQVKELRKIIGYNAMDPYDPLLIVGNFATARSIKDFVHHCGKRSIVDAFKVGIGGGSACTTRVVTGVGIPTLGSVLDCVSTGFPIIADGGFRTSGDVAKAFGAGACAVMLGSMLAGTDETPGEVILTSRPMKRYRGSASRESYADQGKIAEHRTPEGETFLVPLKGPVKHVLQDISAGVKSAMAYVGANNLDDFRERCEFVEVSPNCVRENGAHGKKV
jgi:IMP dehydrogenase